jgi:predicted nucleic acid-binding protein
LIFETFSKDWMMNDAGTTRRGEGAEERPGVPRLFFDADVLLAGAASDRGASRLLLKASELGLVAGFTAEQAVVEARRNLHRKLPEHCEVFEALIQSCLQVAPDPAAETEKRLAGHAVPDDLPLLSVAVECRADFLLTFNTRHYFPTRRKPRIMTPGNLLKAIRAQLSALADGDVTG